jgi:hypothetical protein
MDNLDNAFWWSVLSLPALVLVANYVLRWRYNELMAIHLLVFWGQFFAYGVLWLSGQPNFFFPEWAIVYLAFELTVYCGLFYILAPLVSKHAYDVSNAALEVPTWTLLAWIAPSVTLSIFIVASYGVVALIPYANIAESAGLPSWLVYLNLALIAPAWGAVYCCAVRFAHRRFHPIQLLALGFVVGRMFFETGQGKRYVLIFCLVAALFRRERPYRVTGRIILNATIAAILIFAMWSWYEGIRRNMGGMLMGGKAYDSAFDAIGDIITPSESAPTTNLVTRDVVTRVPPIWFLLQILQLPDLGHGEYVTHAIQNVVPSIAGDKQFENENDVLANTTDFPAEDYPWTLLTELQAETSVWAVLLTPPIYIFLFWFSWVVIARWRGRSNMIVLVAIGVAIFLGGEVQNHLSKMFADLRMLAIYIALGFVLLHLRNCVRAILALWDSRLRQAMRFRSQYYDRVQTF